MINIQTHIISEAFEQLSRSAKLKESKLTEAKIDRNKFNTGKYEYFVEIKYYEEEPDTFHVRADSISDLEDKLSNDDYIEYYFDMTNVPKYTGILKQLRFDPISNLNNVTGEFGLDYVYIGTKD